MSVRLRPARLENVPADHEIEAVLLGAGHNFTRCVADVGLRIRWPAGKSFIRRDRQQAPRLYCLLWMHLAAKRILLFAASELTV